MNNETPQTIQRLVDALVDDDPFTRFFLSELLSSAMGWELVTDAMLTHCEDSIDAVNSEFKPVWRDRLEKVRVLKDK